jgi:hypothetical protein
MANCSPRVRPTSARISIFLRRESAERACDTLDRVRCAESPWRKAAIGFLLVGCLGGSRAGAATFHVDGEAGSDTAQGTSPETAWQTIAKINATRLMPGDVVAFHRGGRYPGKLTIQQSGTAQAPIRFTAYGQGSRPVLDGGGSATWPPHVVLVGPGVGHVVIDSVQIQNVHDSGVFLDEGSHHNVVRDCEITETGIGVTSHGSHNTITRNDIHDLHMVRNDPAPDNDYGAIAVLLSGASDDEVSYNRFVRCRAASQDYGHDGGGVEFYGTVTRCLVHHNYAEDCEGFMEVGGRPGEQAHDNAVYYNVAVGSREFGVFHNAGTGGVDIRGFRVENNTVVSLEGKVSIFWFRAPPTPASVLVQNNLIVMGPGNRITNSPGFTHGHNLFWRTDGSEMLGLALDDSDLNACPRFLDIQGGDYHLRPGSPAVERGASLGHLLDFEDRAVPVGRAPDLGAYEYAASQRTDGGPASHLPRPASGSASATDPAVECGSPRPGKHLKVLAAGLALAALLGGVWLVARHWRRRR